MMLSIIHEITDLMACIFISTKQSKDRVVSPYNGHHYLRGSKNLSIEHKHLNHIHQMNLAV